MVFAAKKVVGAVAGAAGLLLSVPATAGAEPARSAAPQECGFSFKAQTFTNCRSFPHRISVYYVSGFPHDAGGTQVHCMPPNTTFTAMRLVGPYRLMTRADDNVNLPCDPRRMP